MTPECALTQEAPQKNAEGTIEWEIAALLIGPSRGHRCLQVPSGSGSDPTLKLRPRRTVTESGWRRAGGQQLTGGPASKQAHPKWLSCKAA